MITRHPIPTLDSVADDDHQDRPRHNARPGDRSPTRSSPQTPVLRRSPAVVSDTMPAGIAGVSWSCVAGLGGACPIAGTGDLNRSVDLAVGASVTFTVTGTVAASTGTITNTAQIDAPAGSTDPTRSTTPPPTTRSIRRRPVDHEPDGLTSAVPGAPISYSIVAALTAAHRRLPRAVTLDAARAAHLLLPGRARAQDPRHQCFGSRDIGELVDVAQATPLAVTAVIAMPRCVEQHRYGRHRPGSTTQRGKQRRHRCHHARPASISR